MIMEGFVGLVDGCNTPLQLEILLHDVEWESIGRVRNVVFDKMEEFYYSYKSQMEVDDCPVNIRIMRLTFWMLSCKNMILLIDHGYASGDIQSIKRELTRSRFEMTYETSTNKLH